MVVESVVTLLEAEFGKETTLTITRGAMHEYLGVRIDFSTPGKVQFSMLGYVQELIEECPADLQKGTATILATNCLFEVNLIPLN